jgi:hypothetical protein
MNNLPIDIWPLDYIGHQGVQGLIPYTPGEIAKWV